MQESKQSPKVQESRKKLVCMSVCILQKSGCSARVHLGHYVLDGEQKQIGRKDCRSGNKIHLPDAVTAFRDHIWWLPEPQVTSVSPVVGAFWLYRAMCYLLLLWFVAASSHWSCWWRAFRCGEPLFLPCDGYHKTREVVCLGKGDVVVVQLSVSLCYRP